MILLKNTSSYNITISKSKHHSKRCMQAERAMYIPFIKIPIPTKETRTQDLNVRKIETWFVICTIMVYCLLIRRDTLGGQTARQAGTGLGIGPGILTVIMNGDPPPIWFHGESNRKLSIHVCVYSKKHITADNETLQCRSRDLILSRCISQQIKVCHSIIPILI